MHIHNMSRRIFRCVSSIVVALFAIVYLSCHLDQLRADVLAVGDVTPDSDPALPAFGGSVSGDIQVGIDGVGRLTIDGPSFTDPLVSEGGIIGVERTGLGEVEVAGITSEWTVNVNAGGTAFKVGQAGVGYLSLVGGATVDVVDDNGMGMVQSAPTIIAEDFSSQGIVTVDGFGSLFNSGDLTIGSYGSGTIDVFNRGTLRSNTAAIGLMNGSHGLARFSGQGSRWTNEGDVEIGTIRGNGDDENGRGTLSINSEALVSIGELDSTPGAEMFTNGETNVNDLGTVEFGGGTLLTYDLMNGGVMHGSGTIQATNSFDITPTGSLRNAASLANVRERLYVADFADASTDITNNGTILSLGGEMEFEPSVTNNLEIVARDAVMHFNGGLTNGGSLTIGGDTTLHVPGGGGINNSGSILVLSDSESLIVGDLIFSGGLLGLTAGPETGTLDIAGEIDLTDAILALDYSAGVEPQVGDKYQVLQATDGIMGVPLNTTTTAGGVEWLFTADPSGTTLYAEVASLTITPIIGADFNGDTIVDDADLLIWRTFFGLTAPAGSIGAFGDADGDGDVDGGDYFRIIRDLGGPPTPLMALAAATVPEPSTMVMALLMAVCCPRRRRAA